MRLWINRGFSMREIAPLMLAADPELELGLDPSQMPAGMARTFAIEEPADDGEIAETAHRFAIDKAWPQRRLDRFAEALAPERIELPAPLEAIATLQSKALLAEAMRDAGDPLALPTERFASVEEYDRALAQLADLGPLCIKPEIGVFGHGFWRLASGQALKQLADPDARKLDPGAFRWLAGEAERAGTLEPHVLMPWLPGPEVTIDLLARHGTLLHAVTRTKLKPTLQRVASAHPLLAHAETLVARFALNGLIGIQYRLAADGNWRLLEINLRAAGGIVASELAGAGLVASWAGLLTGRLQPGAVPRPAVDAFVTLAERREIVPMLHPDADFQADSGPPALAQRRAEP